MPTETLPGLISSFSTFSLMTFQERYEDLGTLPSAEQTENLIGIPKTQVGILENFDAFRPQVRSGSLETSPNSSEASLVNQSQQNLRADRGEAEGGQAIWIGIVLLIAMAISIPFAAWIFRTKFGRKLNARQLPSSHRWGSAKLVTQPPLNPDLEIKGEFKKTNRFKLNPEKKDSKQTAPKTEKGKLKVDRAAFDKSLSEFEGLKEKATVTTSSSALSLDNPPDESTVNTSSKSLGQSETADGSPTVENPNNDDGSNSPKATKESDSQTHEEDKAKKQPDLVNQDQAELIAEIDALKLNLKELESVNNESELKSKVNDLVSQLETESNKNVQVQSEIDSLRNELDELKSDKDSVDLQTQVEQLQSELVAATQEKEAAGTGYQEENERLSESLKTALADVEKAALDNSHVSEIESQLETRTRENADLLARIDALTKELDGQFSDEKSVDLLRQIEEMRDELAIAVNSRESQADLLKTTQANLDQKTAAADEAMRLAEAEKTAHQKIAFRMKSGYQTLKEAQQQYFTAQDRCQKLEKDLDLAHRELANSNASRASS